MSLFNWVNGVTKLNKATMDEFSNNIENAISGTVLYENEQGTTNKLNLNGNRNNYTRLVFYGKNTGEASETLREQKLGEVSTSATEVTLNIIRQRDPNLYMYLSDWEFKGNELSCYANYRSYFNANSYIGRDTASLVAITKIVGYKY